MDKVLSTCIASLINATSKPKAGKEQENTKKVTDGSVSCVIKPPISVKVLLASLTSKDQESRKDDFSDGADYSVSVVAVVSLQNFVERVGSVVKALCVISLCISSKEEMT